MGEHPDRVADRRAWGRGKASLHGNGAIASFFISHPSHPSPSPTSTSHSTSTDEEERRGQGMEQIQEVVREVGGGDQ